MWMLLYIGKNFRKISTLAKLNTNYTNHSIRTTCITLLDDAGFEPRHIMRTSGHRSETSIRSYSHRLSDNKKRQISETLSSAVGMSNSMPITSSAPSPQVISANLASGVSVAPPMNALPPPVPSLDYKKRQTTETLSSVVGMTVAAPINILPPAEPLPGSTASIELENVDPMELSDSQLLDFIDSLRASPSRTSDQPLVPQSTPLAPTSTTMDFNLNCSEKRMSNYNAPHTINSNVTINYFINKWCLNVFWYKFYLKKEVKHRVDSFLHVFRRFSESNSD